MAPPWHTPRTRRLLHFEEVERSLGCPGPHPYSAASPASVGSFDLAGYWPFLIFLPRCALILTYSCG